MSLITTSYLKTQGVEVRIMCGKIHSVDQIQTSERWSYGQWAHTGVAGTLDHQKMHQLLQW